MKQNQQPLDQTFTRRGLNDNEFREGDKLKKSKK